MKVLIIHNILWTHYKSVLFEAIERQKIEDIEICVLQIAKNDISRKDMVGSSINYKYHYHLLFDDFIENVPTSKKISTVLKYIYNYNPDVVNVTGWAGDWSLTASIVFSFLLGKKIIISNESTPTDQKRSFFKELVKKILVKMSDGFITFGKTSKRYLLELGALADQIIEDKGAVVDDIQIREIYESALTEGFLNKEVVTKHNFIFVGRVIAVKNIPVLIRAFQNLKKEVHQASDWGLIILGNGTLDEDITLEIQRQEEHIYKFDGVGWQTVPKYFSKSDCLVLPSNSETWGLVVNEAMICGLAVIVSDACGCREDLIDGNGYIFEAGNQDKLKVAMQNIVSNLDNLENMKKQSVEIIEQFKVNNVANRIIIGFQNIYQKK